MADNRCDNRWTASQVEERIEEAADTLRRLPEKRVQTARSSWPKFIQDCHDACGTEPTPLRRGPPAAAAIDRMDETLAWLAWVEVDQARILWSRATGVRWKAICWRMGTGRDKAWRTWVAALVAIAERLNGGRSAPAMRRSRAAPTMALSP